MPHPREDLTSPYPLPGRLNGPQLVAELNELSPTPSRYLGRWPIRQGTINRGALVDPISDARSIGPAPIWPDKPNRNKQLTPDLLSPPELEGFPLTSRRQQSHRKRHHGSPCTAAARASQPQLFLTSGPPPSWLKVSAQDVSQRAHISVSY